MRNFISGVAQQGETLAVDSVGDNGTVVGGDPVQIGVLNGVAFNDADSDGNAVVDQHADNIYTMSVRNVRTYAGGAEATYGAIAVGDNVYFDKSQQDDTIGAGGGVKLSTSPNNGGTSGTGAGAAANKVWGIAMSADATATAKTATIRVKMVARAV